ncbi:MAG: hypothetical protein HC841_09090 [Verrucomicrobiae bacterium]|nr:hypothetical protein [Verrucomicrobiae bacterium]
MRRAMERACWAGVIREGGRRREVAQLLELPVERIPEASSLAYDQIVAGVAAGRIKALWIIATNPAHSWIGRAGGGAEFDSVLGKLDFLVVQDLYTTTDSARHAHLMLPAPAGVKRRARSSTANAASAGSRKSSKRRGRR